MCVSHSHGLAIQDLQRKLCFARLLCCPLCIHSKVQIMNFGLGFCEKRKFSEVHFFFSCMLFVHLYPFSLVSVLFFAHKTVQFCLLLYKNLFNTFLCTSIPAYHESRLYYCHCGPLPLCSGHSEMKFLENRVAVVGEQPGGRLGLHGWRGSEPCIFKFLRLHAVLGGDPSRVTSVFGCDVGPLSMENNNPHA